MEQMIVNSVIAAFGAAISFILKRVWDAIHELQERDHRISEKLYSHEVLVAGHYIKRESFDQAMENLYRKLDVISDKLDRKADK